MTKRELTKRQIKFCELLIKLDKIPRYGRLYYYDKYDNRSTIWKWQRYGRWGWRILKRLNLLWPYIDHITPPIEEGELITDPETFRGKVFFTPGWDK